MQELTGEAVVVVAAAAVSLLFEYFPWLSAWYDQQTSDAKQGFMLIALAVVVIAAYGLSCGGFLSAVSCTGAWQQIAFEAIVLYVAALTVNQGTHRITKRHG